MTPSVNPPLPPMGHYCQSAQTRKRIKFMARDTIIHTEHSHQTPHKEHSIFFCDLKKRFSSSFFSWQLKNSLCEHGLFTWIVLAECYSKIGFSVAVCVFALMCHCHNSHLEGYQWDPLVSVRPFALEPLFFSPIQKAYQHKRSRGEETKMELAILTVKHDLLFSFSGWLILVRGLYHPKENGHWLWAFIAITPTATGLKGESSLQKKKEGRKQNDCAARTLTTEINGRLISLCRWWAFNFQTYLFPLLSFWLLYGPGCFKTRPIIHDTSQPPINIPPSTLPPLCRFYGIIVGFVIKSRCKQTKATHR